MLGLLENLVSRLAFFVFLRFSFHGFRWIAGLARLAGRFGFLALLEAGLNHVVSHARRQDGSADLTDYCLSLIHISEPTRPY